MATNIELVKKTIKSNLRDLKKVEDVAQLLGASTETLRKDFIREEKIPLSDYIRLKRVETMSELLTGTRMPCYLIGFEVGFRREDTAAKVFKKLTGLTMQEYRKRQNGNHRH
jgi:two-component system response regulator YesN